ncbi:ATPase [Ureibacillus massiliensis 4400831 = CIP 108448 = CCUG 49529]|uniref:P-type Ca(2+) transporter n=1 Tax=Ureibacillus massiliensis 4400831 = CIP 108448 = CCUG 49529 TaxID=1211035 RepID=A0A0A3J3T2_9BACL|nr:calcium-translocating P-type ATPase, PMCA-type [Ureibacillus massiliensis]KGR90350.1 ATPase [Ureibacillus massiliensis 4400831 = CIP 108448 = CCUG 49529]
MNATEYYREPIQKVLNELEVTQQGLTEFEVQTRRKQFGYNELKEGKRKSAVQIFLEQFTDFLVIILMIAAIISVFLGEVQSSIVILVVVILNAVLGTVQQIKAEKSLDSLKDMAAPIARVLRDGQVVEIPSKEVVVGDIVILDAGDYVCADGRIIESYSLQINESSLTGESLPIEKMANVINEEDVALGDKKNMVFSGCFVTNGRGKAIVTSIGMNTEIGKIANLLENAKEKKTPLQVSLEHFGKRLAIGIIIICIIIFGLDILRGREMVDSFMFAVSLAVAAIPEALSSIVTIVLAFGTQKMAKENAIIRKLHAVESLGSISVICSDKTGTLTKNKMTVQKIYLNEKVIAQDQLQMRDELQNRFVHMALLCNDSVTSMDKEIGDPTEVALVRFGNQYNLNEHHLRKQYRRLGEIPFDSTRKLMSTVNRIGNKYIMITKGAVDVLLSRIVKIETSQGVKNITNQQLEAIKQINENFSNEGLRVLAFVYKEVNSTKVNEDDENDYTFVGLAAMMDPPREESKQAVEDCIKAGIKPVMITGDHKITAAAIAKQIGILKDPSEAIEGKEIDLLTDKELRDKIQNISVFARVSPEHKIRIVKAWQQKGIVVAMTGDGVNDGPALKQADIGVAMGITGTEVAKEASSMILTDDNFSTIVKAISNGRSLYANIKNAIKFLLSGNTGAILVVLYATLFALPAPFAPVHLLFINLLTDSLPAIAIGLEPHNKKLMDEKPRNIHEPLLNKRFVSQVGFEGLIIAAVTIIAFQIGLATGDPIVASTMAFATLCLARLFHGFNCRSDESIFKIGLFSNLTVWIAFLIGFTLLNTVLILGLFEVAVLTRIQLLMVYGLAIVPLIIIQLDRIFFSKDDNE